MNKNYNENTIQELLIKASQNVTPRREAFDVLLTKLDTTVIKETIYSKPVVSNFSIFRLAGAFTAFVLVVLGVRNMTAPLQNGAIPIESDQASLLTENSGLALGPVGEIAKENTGIENSDVNPNTGARFGTFAKNSAQTSEAREIESATLNSIAAESGADSELLALSEGI